MGSAGLIDIKTPTEKYLYKYLDLHKFIDFLHTSELHFTRLDSFNDPIEGVKTSLLRERELYKGMAKTSDGYNPNLPPDQIQGLINTKNAKDQHHESEIQKSQQSQFVSCWFRGERESMAMWEIYSGRNSVCLRIDPEELVEEVKSKAESFVDDGTNKVYMIGDSVAYLKLNPFDRKMPLQTREYAGMKKDVSYQHEQEYRFLISADHSWVVNTNKRAFRFKLDTTKLKFHVVCHPLMESWQLGNIEKLVANSELGFTVDKSEVELKR